MADVNPDTICPRTGEVCQLKLELSQSEYQFGAPEESDYVKFAREQGLTDRLGLVDILKLGLLTGHLVEPDVAIEDKDKVRHSLNDEDCEGSRRSMILFGKKMCRARVVVK